MLALVTVTATLEPPKPKELFRAARSPSGSRRGSFTAMSMGRPGSRFSMLMVGGGHDALIHGGTEGGCDGVCLSDIALWGRGAVGVDVLDVAGLKIRSLQGLEHGS